MLKKTVFIILVCFSLSIKAQIGHDQISTNIQVFEKEIPRMTTNTDLLLVGERLHYKLFNLNEQGKVSSLSKVSYVSLRTNKDSIVFDHKLKLENGLAHGTFFIPTSLKTGIYRLFGYTNFSLNNQENAIAHRKVYIINPFIKSETNIQKDSTRTYEMLSISDVISDLKNQSIISGLSIHTDKPAYAKRDKIVLSIKNINEKYGNGNYVLSVRRVHPVELSNSILSEDTIEIRNGSIFHIPELRGELISGKVIMVDSEVPVANKIVALSLPGKNYVFKTARTNINGHFFISIDEPYETTNGVIQINDPKRNLFKIVLDEKRFSLKEKALPFFKFDPSLKDWLQERSIQLQIENAYYKQDSITTTENSVTPFYSSLATEYILEDYTRFSTLEETFVEIIAVARIRKRNGIKTFEVFDPYNPYKNGAFDSFEPLLLVDGVLVQDVDDIFSYSAKEIESIKVFPKAYRYGAKIYQGIIDFRTNAKSYRPRLNDGYLKEFKQVKPLIEKEYSFPDYTNNSYNRLPDYRTQLLWKPYVQLSSKEVEQIFYTSDVPGSYEIVLEGYTNNGEHIVLAERFIVN